MANFDRLVKMINKADEDNTEIVISYALDSDDVSMSMVIMPELLIMGEWVSISDKKDGMRSYFTFNADTEVEYDEDEEEYTISVGDGTLIIAES